VTFEHEDNWEVAEDYKVPGIPWRTIEPNQHSIIYTAVVGNSEWKIRINDFPAEPLYTLIVDCSEIIHFNDWPKEWVKPT
jgi:hypothetical protein